MSKFDEEEERQHVAQVVREAFGDPAGRVQERDVVAVVLSQRALAREQAVADAELREYSHRLIQERERLIVAGAIKNAKLAAIEAMTTGVGNVCGLAVRVRRILAGEP